VAAIFDLIESVEFYCRRSNSRQNMGHTQVDATMSTDTATNGRGTIANLAWIVAALALWLLCLPMAWFVVNSVHVLITAAEDFPSTLGQSTFSYVYAGIAPLVASLVALWWLGKAATGRSFRFGAVAICLLFGSWFGLYLVGTDEVVIQLVLLAWALFGAFVPRPFGQTAARADPGRSGSGPRET
jgi:hypothetical protein